jgi:hypothetical protein
MPATIAYNEALQIVTIGDGEFGPVSSAVWEYTVGGRNVIKAWFGYRKNDPAGKRSSPLDDIHADIWDPDWTGESIDLLTVLTRLTELEEEQAALLATVLNGGLLSRAELAAEGVKWPSSKTDRLPRHGLNDVSQHVDGPATLI